MKKISFLSRFKLMKVHRMDVSEDVQSSDYQRRLPLVKKSELKVLFRNVLEEKQADLPSRRR
ncbi:hypothetical protein [Ruegeria arenilitoris]|uniref:hypothetical protein n=1 Tax=Ruegeria arenilitoris TaxID=1173585 RepID=UPI001480A8BE|nr:hypothetical protein [Ruegeria arenilitoris]